MTINLEDYLKKTVEVQLRNGNVVTGKVGKTFGVYYIGGFHRNGMTIEYNENGTCFCLDNFLNEPLHDIIKIKQIKEPEMNFNLEYYLGETVEVELWCGDIITGKLRKLENPSQSSRPYYIDSIYGDCGYWTQYGVYNSNLIASHKDIIKIKEIKELSRPETMETNVIRSKIDVFTTENERVELTVDDEGIFLTACNGGAREDLSIGSKDIAIEVAKAILEHYQENQK